MKIKLSTRLVLVLRNIVIKIPLSKRGYLQGKNEKQLYDKYKETGMIGELYSERFGIVVMKRYPVCSRIPQWVVAGIKKDIPELNVINCDLYNVKNWGMDHDGFGFILIDYGINEEVSKMYKPYKK